MKTPATIIPIYTTRGDLGALLVFPYLYDLLGDWIGWVTPERQVYSVQGFYVGFLIDGPRIVRKRAADSILPRRNPPAPPAPIRPPAHVPLPPQMSELSLSMIDVLDEEPELLHGVDAGELREDLD